MLSTKSTYTWSEVAEKTKFPGGKIKFLKWLREMDVLDDRLKPNDCYDFMGFFNYKNIQTPVSDYKDKIYSWSTLKGLNFLIQLVDIYILNPKNEL